MSRTVLHSGIRNNEMEKKGRGVNMVGKLGVLWVLKVQQIEACRTGLRVSSLE